MVKNVMLLLLLLMRMMVVHINQQNVIGINCSVLLTLICVCFLSACYSHRIARKFRSCGSVLDVCICSSDALDAGLHQCAYAR
jgi:hypothetical protein